MFAVNRCVLSGGPFICTLCSVYNLRPQTFKSGAYDGNASLEMAFPVGSMKYILICETPCPLIGELFVGGCVELVSELMIANSSAIILI